MDFEKKLEELEKNNAKLREEVEFLEFRIDLIASRTHTNQVLYEYNVNRTQYNAIMDLMDDVRKELDEHRDYNHATFEEHMRKIFPDRCDPRNDFLASIDLCSATVSFSTEYRVVILL